MNKLFTSTLLTVVAVPFLMAAPSVAKKVQNQAPASTQADSMSSATGKTKAKKHVKKAKTAPAVNSAAPSAPAQK